MGSKTKNGAKRSTIKVEGNTISGTAADITERLKKVADKINLKESGNNQPEHPIEIKGASLKDDFCNYTYELTQEPTKGDTCKRSGASIIHDDMKAAFKKLNVHLAVICEELPAEDIQDIEHFENMDFGEEQIKGSTQELVQRFTVSSFMLDGDGEKESITLVGEKRLSTGEYVKLTTPKKSWFGDYAFVNELRVAIDDLKIEVEEYMNGKAAPKMVQTEMFEEEKLVEEDV